MPIRALASIRAPIRRKLVVAFAIVAVVLIVVGSMGVYLLGRSNDRAEQLEVLARKVSVYRQLQSDTNLKLYTGAAAFSDPAQRDAALRQLNQSYDFGQVEFLGRDEGELIDLIQSRYGQFVEVMTTGLEPSRAGEAATARAVLTRARPLADELERLTNQLVNRAEADTAELVAANDRAYRDSRLAFVGITAGGVTLAALLGFAIASMISRPVTAIDRRLGELAAGDFAGHVEVPNRDELGTLATNLNRMNDELGRLYTDLAAASRHKSEFLANMSHELRTPLNAVIGFSDVLSEQLFGPLNSRQADYVADIAASGRHLLLLINDILDLAKVEAGRLELELSDFALEPILEVGLTMVRERARAHRIDLRLHADTHLGEVEADERKVKQIVFNLVSNAVKFTPDGGSVDVFARREGELAVLAVRDTGPGIAQDDLERIFVSFEQVGQREGTGLGLPLARSLAELHGGTLEVVSEVGVGSTFTLSLPVRSIGVRSGPVAAEAKV
ncbi:MAG: ATP-binding protein [Sporichthyaceae bacterium]